MTLSKTQRGFEIVEHPNHLTKEPCRLVQQSSAIGNYDDAIDRPGSSMLWVGEKHSLNREEAAELALRIFEWTRTGSLEIVGDTMPAGDE